MMKKSLKEDFEEKICTTKRIQEEVLNKMSQLYLTHMKTSICSEKQSDIKSMKVNNLR
jgi:hypothetical protein